LVTYLEPREQPRGFLSHPMSPNRAASPLRVSWSRQLCWERGPRCIRISGSGGTRGLPPSRSWQVPTPRVRTAAGRGAYENGPGQHRQQPTSQPDHTSKEDCCLPKARRNRNGFMRIGIWPPGSLTINPGPMCNRVQRVEAPTVPNVPSIVSGGRGSFHPLHFLSK
jgi:hypothetical protein